jgi:Neuraminidase (sialidase)
MCSINGAASITEKTNVVEDSTDDQALCAIGIDTDDDTFYCFYAGKSDGTETAYTALNVYYKTSDDGGTTWGSETQLTSEARGLTYINCSLEFASGEFAVVYLVTGGVSGLALLNSALA